jgi:hypothetical protein
MNMPLNFCFVSQTGDANKVVTSGVPFSITSMIILDCAVKKIKIPLTDHKYGVCT